MVRNVGPASGRTYVVQPRTGSRPRGDGTIDFPRRPCRGLHWPQPRRRNPSDDHDHDADRRPGPPGREALHLRVGRRPCRRRRDDARPSRREGRRPRGDDERGPPGPARVHDHDRGMQRLLHGRRTPPRRPLGRRACRREGGRGADRQGLRRPLRPAACLRPLGCEVLDARDDGHGPQPRPERGDAPRSDRADRQRAVRLGRVPALHPDVRADRHGREARAVRRGTRGGQARPRRRAGHRSHRR